MNVDDFNKNQFMSMGYQDTDAEAMMKFIKEGFKSKYTVLETSYNSTFNRIILKRKGVSVRFDSGPDGNSVSIYMRCSTGGYRKCGKHSYRNINDGILAEILELKGGEIIRKDSVPKPKSFEKDDNDIYYGVDSNDNAYARICERPYVRATMKGLAIILNDGRMSFDGIDTPGEEPWFLFEMERGRALGHVFAAYSDKKYLMCVQTSGRNYRIVKENHREMTKWKDAPNLTHNDHKLIKLAIEKFQETIDV